MTINGKLRTAGMAVMPIVLAGAAAGCRPTNDPNLKPERNLVYIIGHARGVTQKADTNDVYKFDLREELNALRTGLEEHKKKHDSEKLREAAKFMSAKVFEQLGEYDKAIAEYNSIKAEKSYTGIIEQNKKFCEELLKAGSLTYHPEYNKQISEFDSKIAEALELAKKYKDSEYLDNAKKLWLDLDVKRIRYISGEEVEIGGVRALADVPEDVIANEFDRIIVRHKDSNMHDELKRKFAEWFERKADEYARKSTGSRFNPGTYCRYTSSSKTLYQDIIRKHPETNSYRIAKASLKALEEKERDVLKNH